jgi:hypothetical protein
MHTSSRPAEEILGLSPRKPRPTGGGDDGSHAPNDTDVVTGNATCSALFRGSDDAPSRSDAISAEEYLKLARNLGVELARKYGISLHGADARGDRDDGAGASSAAQSSHDSNSGGSAATTAVFLTTSGRGQSPVAGGHAASDNADAEELRKRISKAEARIRALDAVLAEKESEERRLVERRLSQGARARTPSRKDARQCHVHVFVAAAS